MAIASGVLTEAQSRSARDALARLDRLALASALRVDDDDSVATPGLAFALAGIEEGQIELLAQWRDHEGTTEQFWSNVELGEYIDG